jgi:transposase InsO family protein
VVIQTDNGAEFQSQFHWHLEEHNIRHVYTRPRTPHLNGKVERSHRVDEQEFRQPIDRARQLCLGGERTKRSQELGRVAAGCP